MIGNDIVDLCDPETRPEARHPRFDSRVFGATERDALRGAVQPDRMRWILWAAKEAAYKVACKLDANAIFSPRSFVVSLDVELRGTVSHAGRELPVRVHSRQSGVHAIVTDTPGRDVLSESGVLAGTACDPSQAVRSLAVSGLARRLGAALEDLAIGRRGRIPTILLRGQPTPLDLSLSHHGRHIAFACELGRAA